MKVWRKYYNANAVQNVLRERTFSADFTMEMVIHFMEATNKPMEGFPIEGTYCFVKMSDAIEIPDDNEA